MKSIVDHIVDGDSYRQAPEKMWSFLTFIGDMVVTC